MLFATTSDGKQLLLINASGGSIRSISLPATAGGFVWSDRG